MKERRKKRGGEEEEEGEDDEVVVVISFTENQSHSHFSLSFLSPHIPTLSLRSRLHLKFQFQDRERRGKEYEPAGNGSLFHTGIEEGGIEMSEEEGG